MIQTLLWFHLRFHLSEFEFCDIDNYLYLSPNTTYEVMLF